MSGRPITHAVDPTTELPAEFTDRLRQILPAAALDCAWRSFRGRSRVGLRLNTLLADAEATAAELTRLGLDVQRVSWSSVAATIPVDQKPALTAAPAVGEGRVYVQDLASQLAPLVLAPRPGESVLDLAAAPGGKALQIAALMQASGYLAAVESVAGRWYTLRDNVRLAGAGEFVKLFRADGRHIGRKTPERFDAVLLDAPCSSEARFVAGDSSSWKYWGPRKIAESARKQKALLRSAIDALRVGGRVVYATCSFAPEENEAIINHTLRRLGEAVMVEPIELPIANQQSGLAEWQGKRFQSRVAGTVRVLPTEMMAGLYLAKLRKLAATATTAR